MILRWCQIRKRNWTMWNPEVGIFWLRLLQTISSRYSHKTLSSTIYEMLSSYYVRSMTTFLCLQSSLCGRCWRYRVQGTSIFDYLNDTRTQYLLTWIQSGIEVSAQIFDERFAAMFPGQATNLAGLWDCFTEFWTMRLENRYHAYLIARRDEWAEPWVAIQNNSADEEQIVLAAEALSLIQDLNDQLFNQAWFEE